MSFFISELIFNEDKYLNNYEVVQWIDIIEVIGLLTIEILIIPKNYKFLKN